jgi:hypothetical protein
MGILMAVLFNSIQRASVHSLLQPSPCVKSPKEVDSSLSAVYVSTSIIVQQSQRVLRKSKRFPRSSRHFKRRRIPAFNR